MSDQDLGKTENGTKKRIRTMLVTLLILNQFGEQAIPDWASICLDKQRLVSV